MAKRRRGVVSKKRTKYRKRRRQIKPKKARKQKTRRRRGKKKQYKDPRGVWARNYRKDIREHGSVYKARKARRLRAEEERKKWAADEAAWRAAFTRRHGRAPSSDGVDSMVDYNYTWRDRYAAWERGRAAAGAAASAPRPRPTPSRSPRPTSPRRERLLVKLRALADHPETPANERARARDRIAELS